MYAIVDIETTGGHANANGITEIAIILHDGVQEEGRYTTLVRPGYPIPRYVASLTGITDDMVATAPPFEEIADKVFRLLKGRIFVAHNVNFDYSFVKYHLEQAGLDLTEQKLCTVRLSRKVLPGLPSYSLGNLCRSLGIPVEGRHRAIGDAQATSILFKKILDEDSEGHVSAMLRTGSREAYLPLHMDAGQIDQLPASPGVYYFHDAKDKVVYVGKAVNLRKRVVSHFSNNGTGRRKQEFIRKVHRISCQPLGSALVASVMESIEIKRLWPVFNYSQKRMEFPFGIYAYEDRRGLLRLTLERKRRHLIPILSVPNLNAGYAMLRSWVREAGLCPRHAYLQKSGDECVGVEEGYCKGVCKGEESFESYNERVRAAIAELDKRLPSFALFEPGRTMEEHTVMMMEKGEFVGMGYVKESVEQADPATIREQVTPYPGNELIKSIVLKEAETHPEKVLRL